MDLDIGLENANHIIPQKVAILSWEYLDANGKEWSLIWSILTFGEDHFARFPN